MDSIAADALIIDSTSCQAFLERLVNSSPSEIQPRHTDVHQVYIVEQDHRLLPQTFADTLKHGAAHLRRALPRLVALRVQSETSNCLRGALHCILTLASTLTRLHLQIGRNTPLQMAIIALDSMCHRLPQLRSLDVDVELDFASPGQALDVALSLASLCGGLPSLSSLRLPLRVVEKALHHDPNTLTRLSNLRELSIFAAPHALHHITSPSRQADSNTPTALRTLRISAPLVKCTTLLPAIPKSLDSLYLSTGDAVEAKDISRALRSMLEHFSPPSPPHSSHPGSFPISSAAMNTMFFPHGIPQPATMSSLVDITLDIPHGTPDSANWCAFMPLLSARNLEQLSIFHIHPLSYNEQDLLDMLGSWHKIGSLALNPRPCHGPVSLRGLPSLGVLAAIGRSGPSLRVFRALVDGSIVPSSLPRHTWGPTVAALDLGYSVGSCKDAELKRSAEFVGSLFPGVKIRTEDCSEWALKLGQRVNA